MGTDLTARRPTDTRAGIVYGLAAYGFWGLMPLYFYASDANPGDTTGQGVGGVWFVVAP